SGKPGQAPTPLWNTRGMTLKALVTTVPFASHNRLPLEILESAGINYSINPLGRRLTEAEMAEITYDFDILIAGTEPITDAVLERSPRLKLIARVGIGLDNVDLHAARERRIAVTYTPDAPAPAVAELTIGNILTLLRGTHVANLQMRRGEWVRILGRRIPDVTIGVIGVGRIGGRVLRRLAAFGSPRVLANDVSPNLQVAPALKLEWTSKDAIFTKCDVVTLHVPLTRDTLGLVGEKELRSMKPDALLINTARGGVVDESALYNALMEGLLGGVAIDVFDQEPYRGPLTNFDRCLLTAHMGSMSIDCRSRMEIEATEEAARLAFGKPFKNLVPDSEYDL
ncbi:MAG: phosphoglycerate dehydrogenase, partial [Actinomycetota bacterium]